MSRAAVHEAHPQALAPYFRLLCFANDALLGKSGLLSCLFAIAFLLGFFAAPFRAVFPCLGWMTNLSLPPLGARVGFPGWDSLAVNQEKLCSWWD